MVLSAGWGVGLLVEATVRVVLVYLLPVDVMAGLSSVLGVAGFVVLLTWNMWYIKRVRRRAAGRPAGRPGGHRHQRRCRAERH